MSRNHRTVTAMLGGLTLVAALTGAAAPSAASESCQGRPATVVGSGSEVVGTEGPDVIVAVNGDLTTVRGLGGDDVICARSVADPRSNVFTVEAGAGDDVVDTTAVGADHYLTLDLGGGADRFVGGPAAEQVTADAAGSVEDDVIGTGDGSDSVDSGAAGLENGDRIDLGAGDDRVRLQGSHLAGLVAGGTGRNRLVLGDATGSFTVDAATGTIQRNGVTWTPWTGEFLQFEVEPSAGLTFRGADRSERLLLRAPYTGTPRSVDLAEGEDVLVLRDAPQAGEELAGGAGVDGLWVYAPGAELTLDLGTGSLSVLREPASPATLRASGFEDAGLAAHAVTLRGTAAENDLHVTGCRVTARGLGGADTIYHVGDRAYEETDLYTCPRPAARLYGDGGADHVGGWFGDDRIQGGPGDDDLRGYHGDDRIAGGPGRDTVLGERDDDRLRGGPGADVLKGREGRDRIRGERGPDRLQGGPGRDDAHGGPGRDLCRAEKRRTCER